MTTTTQFLPVRRFVLLWFGILCLAVVGVFAVRAAVAWHAPVSATSSDVGAPGFCGRALTFHPGSQAHVSGGEMSTAQRAAMTAACDEAGRAAWDSGMTSARVAGAAGLAGAGALVTALRRHRR